MSVKLDIPADVKRSLEVARVTAGNSLTPAVRHTLDSLEISRRFQDDAVKDAEGKRANVTKDDNGRPRDEVAAQAGRILTGVQVQAKLAKLNPSLRFEPSKAFPQRICIYIPDQKAKEGKKLVAAMERGPMTEFSVIDIPKEKWVQPTEAKRGWRTTVGHCVRHRAISFEAALREFGMPSHDSEKWHNIQL